MKKWLLFILLIVLSGTAQAHHNRGHQNTEPHLADMDCGKLSNFINKWKALQGALNTQNKDITFEEWKRLQEAKIIYESVCFEA